MFQRNCKSTTNWFTFNQQHKAVQNSESIDTWFSQSSAVRYTSLIGKVYL